MMAIQGLLRDTAYAWRSLRHAPGFSAVVIVTLALGIGVNVAMFSVIYSVLWRPLPYPNADRLVLLGTNIRRISSGAGLSPGETEALRTGSRSLELIAAVSGVDANLNVDGELERVFAVSASDDALSAFGAMPPAMGRGLKSAQDLGADGFVRAVVISDGLWRRRFAADPLVIGRHLQMNNIDVEVVGVLRPGLQVFLPAASNAAEDVDVWFPRPDEPANWQYRDPVTLARMRAGVSLAQVRAELEGLAPQFVRDHPASYAAASASSSTRGADDGQAFRLTVSPLQDVLTAGARPSLLALGAAVAFVLLIACVNVTNLMLARASDRSREMAVRRALGAGRGHIVASLFAESLILAAMGGAAGLIVALWGVDLLEWLRPIHLPRQSQISIDTAVAVYAAAVSSAVCLLIGILPGLRVTGRQDIDALRSGRSGTAAPQVRGLQRALVIGEVALSIVPLVAGGLMVRTVWNLNHVPIGFNPDRVLTAQMAFSFRAFPDADRRWALQRDAIATVRELPGVEAVSAASPLPFAKLQSTRRFFRADGDGSRVLASQQVIFPGYLGVTSTRLREGRDLSDDDFAQRRMVVIVDRRLADRLWPEGALGRQLAVENGQKSDVFEVVGVTDAVRATRVSDDDVAHVFVPFHYSPGQLSLVIRTSQTAAALGPSIKKTVEGLGTLRPVTDIRPMSDYVHDSIGESRFTMLMLVGFAASSLLLAAIGLYGTLAYLTLQRAQEFGIRVALGASMRSVASLVAREAVLLAVAGAAAGLIGALGLAGTIRGLLYGVSPLDPVTVAVVVTAIVAVTIVATAAPALRAARVDPNRVLREM
jgi:putative ABC transport system permease protein